ncbi:MAG: redoxin domain-containing protein [Bacteroidales bacterium]|nr:redoxin domain-containing protein [Bacteroidales bacterium]
MKLRTVLFLIIIQTTNIIGQNIPVVDFNKLEPLLHQKDDKVYIINFWATWCKPCVKEMPAFNQLHKEYANKNVQFLLVSLDFGNNVQDRVQTFIETHKLTPKVIILDDPDGNSWINKVSPNWSGAIPATIIYNKNNRMFYEQSFEFDELEKELQNFLIK